MKTWVLYKRRGLLRKDQDSFGVDVWEGDRRNPSERHHKNDKGYLTTICPEKTARDLAKLVCEREGIAIGFNDVITSIIPTLIPENQWIDSPLSVEEMQEFFRAYKEFGGIIY
jgi:hypothetical protein